jgi:hypothetical protein
MNNKQKFATTAAKSCIALLLSTKAEAAVVADSARAS